ncbi:hypothetical protein [Clostridium sp. CF012]|uniref:hypothetical protein n=1 Tax=Clostridium sp. CF012 TaxID=2843319 RepID=UPI001C0C5F33|nr:hypothetical protein [Clostridium sp. CF012]MBU3142244.1 hypothetical protein [Clostridium sp. CF012]
MENLFRSLNVAEYKKGQKITDLIDITQAELEDIIKNMAVREYKTIYNDKDMSIDLLKERKNKTHKIVARYGDRPFVDCFKEILELANLNGVDK